MLLKVMFFLFVYLGTIATSDKAPKARTIILSVVSFDARAVNDIKHITKAKIKLIIKIPNVLGLAYNKN